MNVQGINALAVLAFSMMTQLGIFLLAMMRDAPVALGVAVAGAALAWAYSLLQFWFEDALPPAFSTFFFGAVAAFFGAYTLAIFGV